MKVVLLCTSKFQFFDLARQLHKREMLGAIITGYPRWKLKNEGIPSHLIRSFPMAQLAYMGTQAMLNKRAKNRVSRGLPTKSLHLETYLEWFSSRAIDACAARCLPDCDVLISSSATGLWAGRVARKRGAVWICDRPCSHIRYQDAILREEHARFGWSFQGIDPRSIEREERIYTEADCVVVPSTFAQRSFTEMGVPDHKVNLITWGVDLGRFRPVATPDPDTFEVLFVGSVTLRKGVPYLLDAFEKLRHPRKKLIIAGSPAPEILPLLKAASLHTPIQVIGHVPQERLKKLMSCCHAFVLPTIEDGFGMVIAEAMACGTPPISTVNSGAPDLYRDGKEGFITLIRDPDALAACLQQLADAPLLRERMSRSALECVQNLGGWDDYGTKMVTLLETLVRARNQRKSAEYNNIPHQ